MKIVTPTFQESMLEYVKRAGLGMEEGIRTWREGLDAQYAEWKRQAAAGGRPLVSLSQNGM